MDQLARDYAGRAHFLFIYAREAHPDDFPEWPAHKSYEQKLAQARALRERFQSPRQFLIDSLDGDVHRQYSGRPNMSWVIDHTGRIAFKGGWTVADDLRAALEMTFDVREMKRAGQRLTPYFKEVMAFHQSDFVRTARSKQTRFRACVYRVKDRLRAGTRWCPA